jgi:hypothetical protein
MASERGRTGAGFLKVRQARAGDMADLIRSLATRTTSWPTRAWPALKTPGLALRESNIALDEAGRRERILAHSPSGKVPTLHAGGAGTALVPGMGSGRFTRKRGHRFRPAWPAGQAATW